jgi:hypothetical protein
MNTGGQNFGGSGSGYGYGYGYGYSYTEGVTIIAKKMHNRDRESMGSDTQCQ